MSRCGLPSPEGSAQARNRDPKIRKFVKFDDGSEVKCNKTKCAKQDYTTTLCNKNNEVNKIDEIGVKLEAPWGQKPWRSWEPGWIKMVTQWIKWPQNLRFKDNERNIMKWCSKRLYKSRCGEGADGTGGHKKGNEWVVWARQPSKAKSKFNPGFGVPAIL